MMFDFNDYLNWTNLEEIKDLIYKNLKSNNVGFEHIIKNKKYYRDYEAFLLDGKLHNDNGPAFILYNNHYKNYPELELYFNHGKFHRIDGPALIYSYNENNLIQIRYYIEDKLHNNEDPAIIEWDNCIRKKISVLCWYNDNKLIKTEKF